MNSNANLQLLEALRDAYRIIARLSRMTVERERLLEEIKAHPDVPEGVRRHISQRVREIDRDVDSEE